MTDSPCRLFVYGTLKPGERAFDRLCQPITLSTQPAMASGRLYHLPQGYPAMTLEPGWVQGVLLTITSLERLQPLDDFEEYYPDRPDRSEYLRHLHPVYDYSRQPLGTAWVYTMPRDRTLSLGGQWLPEGYWSERQGW